MDKRLAISSAVAATTLLAMSSVSTAQRHYDTGIGSNLTPGTATWDLVTNAWATTATPGVAAPGLWVDANTAFFNTGGTNTVTISGAVSAAGLTTTVANTVTNINGGALTLTGNIATSGAGTSLSIGSGTAVTLGANIAVTSLSAVTINGAIGETGGARSLTKSTGNIVLTLTGANTYTGGTIVTGGTLQLSGGNNRLSTTGDITVAGNLVTLNLGANSQSTSGVVNLTRGTVSNGTLTSTTNNFVSNTADPIVVSAVLDGAVGLDKTGAGTLTLSAANTYTGTTTLNTSTGSIRLGNIAGLGTGTLNFNGGTLGLSANLGPIANAMTANSGINFRFDTLSFGAILSGNLTGDATNALTKASTGTLTLTWANTYAGGTTINAGAIGLGSTGAIGTSGTISFGGGALQFSGFNTTDYSARFSNAINQAYRLDTNTQPVTLGTALTSVGGSLTKIGAGTLTLTAANTYDNGTSVSAGTLLLSGANDRLSTTGNISFATLSDTDGINLGGNTQTTSGTVTLGRGALTNGTLIGNGAFNATAKANVSANLQGTAGLNVTSTAGNNITLSGSNNTYSGGTTLNGGATVNVSNADSLGTGSVLFNSNSGILGLVSGAVTLTNAMSATAGQNYRFDASGVLTIGATLAGDSTNGLVKIGTSTLALTGNNTYGGVTTISRGAVSVTSLQDGGVASGIGNSSNAASNLLIGSTTASNPMTLQYVGTTAASTDRLFTAVQGATGSTIDNSAVNPLHTLTFSNTGSLAFGGTGNRTIILGGSNTGDNSFAPLLTDNPSPVEVTSFTKNGAGKWSVTNANTYTGVTNIIGGTLSVASLADGGVASNIGQSSSAATNLLIGNAATLLYTGGAQSTDRSFTINGTSAGHSATLNASGSGAVNFTNTGSLGYGTAAQTRTLILAGTNTGNNTLAATLANNGSGLTSVTKNDAGTWVLTNANTYTGSTTITGGTLLVNNTTGSGTGTGAVSVGAGSTLGGSGSISGAVNVTGTLSPGNSPGTLDIGGNTAFITGSTFMVELNGNQPGDGANDYDQVNVTGTINLTGTVNLAASILPNGITNIASSDIFYILTRSGLGTLGINTFFGLPEGAFVTFNGLYTGQITYLANWTGTQAGSSLTGGNDVALYSVVIPEPTSLAVLGLFGLAALRRRRIA